MAAGNTYWFVEYLQRVFDFQSADFGTTPNVIKCGLITSATTPLVDDAFPTWGGSGSSDMSSDEVTPGGNYTVGGVVCTLPATTINGYTIEIDWANPPAWAQSGSNPTDARWAIFYDDTSANKDCICFFDLGSIRDMTSGNLTLTMGAPALDITCATP